MEERMDLLERLINKINRRRALKSHWMFDRMAAAALDVAKSYNDQDELKLQKHQAMIIAEMLVSVGKLVDAAIDRDVLINEIKEVV